MTEKIENQKPIEKILITLRTWQAYFYCRPKAFLHTICRSLPRDACIIVADAVSLVISSLNAYTTMPHTALRCTKRPSRTTAAKLTSQYRLSCEGVGTIESFPSPVSCATTQPRALVCKRAVARERAISGVAARLLCVSRPSKRTAVTAAPV
jgi:hypothetical protein